MLQAVMCNLKGIHVFALLSLFSFEQFVMLQWKLCVLLSFTVNNIPFLSIYICYGQIEGAYMCAHCVIMYLYAWTLNTNRLENDD